MGQAIARSGDVRATPVVPAPPKGLWPGATNGAWSIGTLAGTATVVELTTSDLVSSDGRSSVAKAVATFSFRGTDGTNAVQGESTVTLQGGSPLVSLAGVAPLVDGDSAEDSYGNKLSVSSSATLATD